MGQQSSINDPFFKTPVIKVLDLFDDLHIQIVELCEKLCECQYNFSVYIFSIFDELRFPLFRKLNFFEYSFKFEFVILSFWANSFLILRARKNEDKFTAE